MNCTLDEAVPEDPETVTRYFPEVVPALPLRLAADGAKFTVTLVTSALLIETEEGTVQAGRLMFALELLTVHRRLIVPVNPFCGTRATAVEPLWMADAICRFCEEKRANPGLAEIIALRRAVRAFDALPFHPVFNTPYDSAAP